MEKRKRSKAEWIRRYVSFVFILFVIAFGTSLSIRANLGSSPISAPPYVLSLIPGMPITMGQIVICMHVVFILTQILLLRRNYELRQLSQILVSFLFGFLVARKPGQQDTRRRKSHIIELSQETPQDF